LSARELEVAHLVAGGLTNKAIAARLHLSVRTVEVHVRHTLAKLGLVNRTQLATWAREHMG
jgi:non-specific serine/threonine protein kinase